MHYVGTDCTDDVGRNILLDRRNGEVGNTACGTEGGEDGTSLWQKCLNSFQFRIMMNVRAMHRLLERMIIE